MRGKHGKTRGESEHWHSEREGPRGHHGHGGGRHRMFEGGELRLVLLHLIAQEPRHGYDLIRAIEGLSRGVYVPSPGVVYPTLTLLRDMGLVGEPDTDNQRKLFSITPQGRTLLDENAKAVEALLQRLGAAGEVRERTDAAPVRRAMHNLKSVLFDKLSARTDEQTVLDVAALIDEAAQKIERLRS
ncbi:PadR family transcriptional regulator [Stigmatella erecta]|uniref:Transcriptional regulator, PadR family n=1 Tax=Stigmatella erecta TaxID=83460 RepID=A0A1I0GS23_9BACT|nr:PadR family transcriptional regulator [Stigmatella erecta]SET73180.1 transcriptional regulator, PadR family [Stigmatella erecta]